jgi:hypothetical protein
MLCWGGGGLAQTLHESTGCFQPRAVPLRLADLDTHAKNYLHGVVLVLKIS